MHKVNLKRSFRLRWIQSIATTTVIAALLAGCNSTKLGSPPSPKQPGNYWKVVLVSHTTALESIACPDAQDCIAGGMALSSAGGYAQDQLAASGAVFLTTDAWKSSTIVPESRKITAVACPAAQRCIAIEAGSSSVPWSTLIFSKSGGKWINAATYLAGPSGALSISCVNVNVCASVGEIQSPLSQGQYSYGFNAFLTDNGGVQWESVPIPPEIQPTSISCTITGYCMSVGRVAGAPSDAVAMASNDSGRTWTTSGQETLVNTALRSVTCVAIRTCIAVGSGGKLQAVWATSNNGGSSWKMFAVDGSKFSSLDSVSCLGKTSQCVAEGDLPASDAKGGLMNINLSDNSWSEIELPNGTPALDSPEFMLTLSIGITCVSPSACFGEMPGGGPTKMGVPSSWYILAGGN